MGSKSWDQVESQNLFDVSINPVQQGNEISKGSEFLAYRTSLANQSQFLSNSRSRLFLTLYIKFYALDLVDSKTVILEVIIVISKIQEDLLMRSFSLNSSSII